MKLILLLLFPLMCSAQMQVSAGSTVINAPALATEISYTAKHAQAALTKIESQTAVQALYVRKWRQLEFGVGAVYLAHTDNLNGSHLNFSLMAGYALKNLHITYRHWSNADTKYPNYGRDMVLVGWRF